MDVFWLCTVAVFFSIQLVSILLFYSVVGISNTSKYMYKYKYIHPHLLQIFAFGPPELSAAILNNVHGPTKCTTTHSQGSQKCLSAGLCGEYPPSLFLTEEDRSCLKTEQIEKGRKSNSHCLLTNGRRSATTEGKWPNTVWGSQQIRQAWRLSSSKPQCIFPIGENMSDKNTFLLHVWKDISVSQEFFRVLEWYCDCHIISWATVGGGNAPPSIHPSLPTSLLSIKEDFDRIAQPPFHRSFSQFIHFQICFFFHSWNSSTAQSFD